jgi:hypothetical protein
MKGKDYIQKLEKLNNIRTSKIDIGIGMIYNKVLQAL